MASEIIVEGSGDQPVDPGGEKLSELIASNAKVTEDLFRPSSKRPRLDSEDAILPESTIKHRLALDYSHAEALPSVIAARMKTQSSTSKRRNIEIVNKDDKTLRTGLPDVSTALVRRPTPAFIQDAAPGSHALILSGQSSLQPVKPAWHPPWKLMRVISGHLGWVRSLAVEPGNKWFCSGSGDRTIKIWDMATGSLRLTLTGHISTVRGLAISARHPYLFSCGEDKMVKCWDLETNKVIRHYHGHLSGVYTLSLHPTLDVLVTGGRDGVARVWDMRTRSNIHVLSGHTGTISEVRCQETDPQVISTSLDSTVRLWDLAAGKTTAVLTHHKKGVRALELHPSERSFATGSTGSIKQWKGPEGTFMHNFDGHGSIINTLSLNAQDVLFSGGKVPLDDELRNSHRQMKIDTDFVLLR